MAHSVQIQYCVNCNGDLRIWVEHWHGVEDPSTTTMTIDLTVNGNTTTQTSAPGGSILNLQSNNFPGCSTPITYATGCPGEENTHNDWVYYDFNGLPQNVPITFTIISGNTVFTMDACNMYPLSVTFTIENLQNLPDILLCEGIDPGPVQLGGGAAWTNNNPAIGSPASGNGSVQNFTPIGSQGTTATINYTTHCGTGSYDYIILPPPTTEFTILNNGTSTNSICLGDSFDFIDNSSIPAPDSIVSWLWDFGDGTTSTTQNPAHTYLTSGTFDVSLTTSSNLGCNSISTIQQVIINAAPISNFGTNPTCANETLLFTDLSTPNTSAIANWQWDILNDNTTEYTIQNPSHIFTNGGTYPVQLTIESIDGCIDSITQNVTVNYLPQVAFISDSVCLGDMTSFTDQSTVTNEIITSWDWDFGFGNLDVSNNPTTSFSTTGNQNVSLTVTTNQGCIASVNGTAFIHTLPTTNFSVNDVCLYNSVSTNNTSVMGNSTLTYSWDFGDGSIFDTSINPSHIYANAGIYQIDLTATSIQNCSSTITQTVTIYDLPIPIFSANSVCVHSSMSFLDSSVPSTGVIVNWQWDILNDNTTEYSTQNTSHTFTNGGTYPVQLTIESIDGCIDSITQNVTVNYLPQIAFISDSVCLGDMTSFTDQSTVTNGIITSWEWDFGFGNLDTSNNPTTLFSATGNQNVSLAVTTDQGCIASENGTAFIQTLPTTNFSVTDVCVYNPVLTNNTSFMDNNLLTYSWNFGDGTTLNTTQNPNHNYSSSGIYQIDLTAISSQNCSSTATQVVKIYDQPIADFSVDTTCLETFSLFSDQSIIPNVINGDVIVNWEWDVDNNTSVDYISQTPQHIYATEGFHNTNLNVTTAFGCQGTGTKAAIVWPLPEVNFSYQYVCLHDSTEFTNLSTISNQFTFNTIDILVWNFGDGTFCTCGNTNHQYSNSTSYGTKLAATTNNGCFNEIIKTITINPLPNPDFSADSICVNLPPTTYTDLSTINSGTVSSWVWNFGDGNSTTGSQAFNSFATDGYFSITLTLTSSEGCVQSITKPIRVYETPIANITSDLTQACNPSDIKFTDLSSSTTSNIESWFWDFGNDLTTTEQNPILTFELEYPDIESELFDIELTVINSHGCTSSTFVSDYLEIFATPTASFTYNPTMPSIMNPEIVFENTSIHADEYAWNFGNDYTSQLTNPIHLYPENANQYNVQLIAYNNSQMCSDTAYASVQIDDVILFYVPNAFTPDGDEYNNIWQPQFQSGYDPFNFHCMIFNRWGEVVWESFNASAGWNGHYGKSGLVEDGTYVWKIDFQESMSAKTHEHVGHVTVLQ